MICRSYKSKFKSAITKILCLVIALAINLSMIGVYAYGYVGDIRWDFFEETEISGFTSNSRAEISVENGALNWEYSNTTSSSVSFFRMEEIPFDSTKHRFLKVRAELPENVANLRLVAPGVSSMPIARMGDGYQTYVYDLENVASGNAVFRLDIMGSSSTAISGTAKIDWIAFDPSETNTDLLSSLTAGQYSVALNASDAPVSLNINYDLYPELLAGDYAGLPDGLSVQADEGVADLSYSSKISDYTDFKLLDITAVGVKDSVSFSRLYRIILNRGQNYKVTDISLTGAVGLGTFSTDVKTYSCTLDADAFEQLSPSSVIVTYTDGVSVNVEIQNTDLTTKTVLITAFAESEEIDQYTIVCTKEEEEQEEIVVSHWNDIRWDFIDASEISSFTSNSRAQISVNEDNLEWEYSNTTSSSVSFFKLEEISFDSQKHRYLKVRAELPENAAKLRLVAPGVDSMPLDRIGDGYQTYVYDLENVASGNAIFRLDIIGGSSEAVTGTAKIDWISFAAEETSPVLISSLSAGEYNIELFESDAPATFRLPISLYSEIQEGTYTGLPAVVSALAGDDVTELSYVSKVTDSTGFKVLDISATGKKDNEVYVRTYRIFVYEKLDYKVTGLSITGSEGLAPFTTDVKTYSCEIDRSTFEEFNSSYVEVSATYGVTVDVSVIDTDSNTKTITITAMAENEVIDIYTVVCTKKAPATYVYVDECEYNGDYISYKGHITGESCPVTLVIYEENTNIFNGDKLMAWEMITPATDGTFSGNISIRDSGASVVDSMLTVKFCVTDISDETTIRFFNGRKVESLINSAVSNNEGLFEFMATSNNGDDAEIYKMLGVPLQEYLNLDSTTKGLVNQASEALKDKITEENIAFLTNATMLIFSPEINNVDLLIPEIKALESGKQKITVWDNKSFTDLSDSVQKTVISNMIANKPANGYSNCFDFLNAIKLSMTFELVKSSAYTLLDDIIVTNKQLFLYPNTTSNEALNTIESGMNTTYIHSVMNTLKTTRQGVMFNTSLEFLSALATAITDTPAGGSGGSGGSGGGGGGGSSATGTIKDSIWINGTPTATGTEKIVFNDLGGYDWAKESILQLNSKGIINGVGDGKFEPGRTINREEFVKLICEAFGFGTSTSSFDFKDVHSDAWYSQYISKAAELGLVHGISETEFGVGTKITREDMAVIIYRACQISNKTISGERITFVDNELIADYALEAVGILSGAGIINGVGDNKFAPKNYATRAEAAALLYRCIQIFALEV